MAINHMLNFGGKKNDDRDSINGLVCDGNHYSVRDFFSLQNHELGVRVLTVVSQRDDCLALRFCMDEEDLCENPIKGIDSEGIFFRRGEESR